MISYTFNIIKRDTKQGNLYNLFRDTVIDKNITKYNTIVLEDEECRIDRICKRLYGNVSYIEELMILNNIINPFSIKSGNIIKFVDIDDIDILRTNEKDEADTEKIANPKKSTRVDPNRIVGVPPTIKPLNFEQLMVDKKNQTIKLNTKLS